MHVQVDSGQEQATEYVMPSLHVSLDMTEHDVVPPLLPPPFCVHVTEAGASNGTPDASELPAPLPPPDPPELLLELRPPSVLSVDVFPPHAYAIVGSKMRATEIGRSVMTEQSYQALSNGPRLRRKIVAQLDWAAAHGC
jgi:hypothetical protein